MALPANDMSMLTASGWPLLALLIAWLSVRGAIGYARRRGMLDQPGRRRSHQLPTPRGGGVGIVMAMLVCLPGVWWSQPAAWSVGVVIGLVVALAMVAAAGWWDDHRSLPVLPRLLTQLLAVGLFSCLLLGAGVSYAWLPLLLGVGVWSINLHNFMDGIDGLLAQQAMFVAGGLALLAEGALQPALAVAAASLALAVAGFWYYNRSPARIFMGDVGSGSIGLLIFACSALLWRVNSALLWPALILSSAFVTDASLTLLTRMWRGRRWYSAHREHLYQWLVRRGATHAQVGVAYLAWNLLVAAPAGWLAWSHLPVALPITMAVYFVAAAVWLMLKHHCLQRHLPRKRCVIT
jgi:UDP-N-acetylmuramyl pentapeptide phosphotransferase/UDP-N-acetylglucosamine-1-phosphate transferase